MSLKDLENFVSTLICGANCDTRSHNIKKPKWWPKHIKFHYPLTKNENKDTEKWTKFLLLLVIRCFLNSSYHDKIIEDQYFEEADYNSKKEILLDKNSDNPEKKKLKTNHNPSKEILTDGGLRMRTRSPKKIKKHSSNVENFCETDDTPFLKEQRGPELPKNYNNELQDLSGDQKCDKTPKVPTVILEKLEIDKIFSNTKTSLCKNSPPEIFISKETLPLESPNKSRTLVLQEQKESQTNISDASHKFNENLSSSVSEIFLKGQVKTNRTNQERLQHVKDATSLKTEKFSRQEKDIEMKRRHKNLITETTENQSLVQSQKVPRENTLNEKSSQKPLLVPENVHQISKAPNLNQNSTISRKKQHETHAKSSQNGNQMYSVKNCKTTPVLKKEHNVAPQVQPKQQESLVEIPCSQNENQNVSSLKITKVKGIPTKEVISVPLKQKPNEEKEIINQKANKDPNFSDQNKDMSSTRALRNKLVILGLELGEKMIENELEKSSTRELRSKSIFLHQESRGKRTENATTNIGKVFEETVQSSDINLTSNKTLDTSDQNNQLPSIRELRKKSIILHQESESKRKENETASIEKLSKENKQSSYINVTSKKDVGIFDQNNQLPSTRELRNRSSILHQESEKKRKENDPTSFGELLKETKQSPNINLISSKNLDTSNINLASRKDLGTSDQNNQLSSTRELINKSIILHQETKIDSENLVKHLKRSKESPNKNEHFIPNKRVATQHEMVVQTASVNLRTRSSSLTLNESRRTNDTDLEKKNNNAISNDPIRQRIARAPNVDCIKTNLFGDKSKVKTAFENNANIPNQVKNKEVIIKKKDRPVETRYVHFNGNISLEQLKSNPVDHKIVHSLPNSKKNALFKSKTLPKRSSELGKYLSKAKIKVRESSFAPEVVINDICETSAKTFDSNELVQSVKKQNYFSYLNLAAKSENKTKNHYLPSNSNAVKSNLLKIPLTSELRLKLMKTQIKKKFVTKSEKKLNQNRINQYCKDVVTCELRESKREGLRNIPKGNYNESSQNSSNKNLAFSSKSNASMNLELSSKICAIGADAGTTLEVLRALQSNHRKENEASSSVSKTEIITNKLPSNDFKGCTSSDKIPIVVLERFQ